MFEHCCGEITVFKKWGFMVLLSQFPPVRYEEALFQITMLYFLYYFGVPFCTRTLSGVATEYIPRLMSSLFILVFILLSTLHGPLNLIISCPILQSQCSTQNTLFPHDGLFSFSIVFVFVLTSHKWSTFISEACLTRTLAEGHHTFVLKSRR